MRPADVTVVEIFPKMFSNKVAADHDALRKFFELEEDNALFISKTVRELVFANPKAHDVLFALLGLIKAERREDKTLRPLRDYRDSFYGSSEIKAEGWVYGIGFKEPEKTKMEIPHKERVIVEPIATPVEPAIVVPVIVAAEPVVVEALVDEHETVATEPIVESPAI